MNGFRLTNYINDLNRQIYASVEQIKHRSSKADINKNTSQVEGGQFDVDKNGEPNGIFRENALNLIIIFLL